ncbi:pentatricopeptide repeat-containing protein At4g18840 [Nicotiana tomentosiformis]|uniref:pentatricopeptide repeat-containing protein At4g18840 n=1 Tax=Nicotiana tomentosiformis TaxID=4098 RepID=UPI00051C2746|nr:pentatricopeptide repeat-containing protein At4g18840 [Nicotiana tomentosiformis]
MLLVPITKIGNTMSMAATLSPEPIFSFIETANSISELHQSHAFLLKTGLFRNPFAASRLLTKATTLPTSSSADTLSYALSIFTHIEEPNSYTYNTIIRAYSTSSFPQLSLIIFLKLLNAVHKIFPDKYTFTFIVKACATIGNAKQGQQVHGLVTKIGLEEDEYVHNTLIHMYAKCGCFGVSRGMIDGLVEDDVIAWNGLLSVFAERGLFELARELFDEMPVKNVESWNFMISGYVNVGLVDEARKVFDEMSDKDVVSWNVMITGYTKADKFAEVLALFEDMLRAKVKPDNCTLVNVLSACAGVGSLSQGKWVHAYIERYGIQVHDFLATALVDMYCKCGCIEKALEVFNGTLRKDISTWNAMIAGLSNHGFLDDALETFNELIADGIKPNEVTFVSVLSTCSQGGLLSEGRRMFDLMISEYRIQPTLVHYGCMVDLLGRFGLLEEAEELLSRLPVKEAPAIWESLLSASRSHNDVELAERIATKLLELDPHDSAGYVQLSNVLASMGRWDDVREVRRKMRSEGVTKEPGCSMIEVDGVVHEFLAGEGIIF